MRAAVMRIAGVVWLLGLAVGHGCAGADALDGIGPQGLGEGDGGTSTGEDGAQTKGDFPDDADGSGIPPPDLGACDSDADCVLAAGGCLQVQGVCEGGICQHDAAPAGGECDDLDACTEDDACDGLGGCAGWIVACVFDNASGGACVDGSCEGMACTSGWGNCDDDWTTGCETSLDSESDCGGCGDPCLAGEHATADCSTGTCEMLCDDPYEDCDEDPSNGCEVPTGIPNQCDADGLNDVNGCWTAHCGNSSADGAVNFGSWFCFDCTTCNVPSAGQCRWCSHDTGTWFPADACACGAFEDLACAP